jgi:hypothetical protein
VKTALLRSADILIMIMYLMVIVSIAVISGILLFTYKYVLQPVSAYIK